MKRLGNLIAPMISATMILLMAPCVYAEDILSKSLTSGEYETKAQKVEYIGEKTSFSVDIPSERADVIELLANEVSTGDDGALEWNIFYGESDNGYISCAFHKSDSGFKGEVENWSELEDVSIYNGLDADGQSYCVAEMNMYGFSAFIGEFPIDKDTWVNITISFPESEMDFVRDDINAMMGSFTRINNNHAEKSSENPDTGESFLPIVVSILMITSAVTVINAVKKHRI